MVFACTSLVALHVPADPGAEAQNARYIQRFHRYRVRTGERRLDLLVKQRDDPVEDLDQIEQDVLALVGHRQALARMLLGLPDARDLQAHSRPDGLELHAREPRVQPVEKVLRDALLLAQDGPPRGLGRVGCEPRLDAHAGNELERRRERVPLLLQAPDAFGDASGLDESRVGEVLAAAAHPVHFLRGVDRLEPGREGAREIGGGLGLAAGRPFLERRRGARRPVGLAPLEGGKSVTFHRLEELLASLIAQHLADEIAESVHVLAQSRVLGGELDGFALHDVAARVSGPRRGPCRPF